ncbi:MAG: sterol desaturase family protein [Chromatiales bacterium]|nr:sterol desaturase family protein [Chromatiales bacterium]
MEAFLLEHEGEIILAAMVFGFVVVALAESTVPRRNITATLGWRWLNNLGLTLVSILAADWVKLALILSTAWWVDQQQFGLLQWWEPGAVASLIVTFLVMDLTLYLYHRWMHRSPLLWRLHAVHHSDTEFDVTLTYRSHPLVVLVMALLRLPVVVALGAPLWALILYEAFGVLHDLFSHANVRIPEKIERWLRYFIVTPDFHRLHHSSDRRYTDSNYGQNFPWFDHLFGTARQRPFQDHESMEIGLERFRDRRDTRLDQMLLMPFRGERFRAPAPPRPIGAVVTTD